MKHLTVVWAMLLLAMACLPCMDRGEAFAQGRATTVQADDLHRHGMQDLDLCTPLCDCNCCGGIKLVTHVLQFTGAQPSPPCVFRNTYLERGAASPSYPFWHPPRV